MHRGRISGPPTNPRCRYPGMTWFQHCIRVLAAWLALTVVVETAPAQTERSPGIRAYWSMGLSDCLELGHVDWAQFDTTSIEEQIEYHTTNGPFLPDTSSDYFAVRLVGKLAVPSSGMWAFLMESDEAARLWINGELVINDGLPHSRRTSTGYIDLEAGEHDIEVRYLERRYSATLVLRWDGPGTPETVIPAEAYSHPIEEPVFDQGGEGLWAYWYDGVSHAENLGHVEWSEHDRVGVVERVSYTLTNGGFELSGGSDHFAARFVGLINIPEEGEWRFELGSDEGAAVYINGSPVIVDDQPHSYRWQAATITLAAGEHAIEVRYLERRYSAGLKLAWRGPSDEYVSIVPASAFRPGSGVVNPGPGGLVAYWYDGVSHATTIGQVDWAAHDRVGTEANVSWKLTNGGFSTDGPTDHFAMRLAGKITVPQSGIWTFGLGSDESARLLINGDAVIDDASPHSFRWQHGTLSLAAGEHDIEVMFLERRYSAGLVLTWKGPGVPSEAVVPREAFEPEEAEDNTPPSVGLRAYWADGLSHAEHVGHVDWSEYDAQTVVPNIAWRLTNGGFRTGGATDYFGVRLVGQVEIDRSGPWAFALGSDESAQLWINGELAIDDAPAHSYRWQYCTIQLEPGKHDIEVRYLERRYSAGLTLTWTPPNGIEEVIPPSAFSHRAQETPFDTGQGGLRAYFNDGVSHAEHVGQVDWELHDITTTVDNISWRLTNGAFRDGGATDHFAARMVGRLEVPQRGNWRFSLGSDESAILFIDGEPVVVDSQAHSFRWSSATVALTAGMHDIEVWFLERRYSAGLFLAWSGPGVPSEIIIPASAFSLHENEEPYESGGGLRAYWTDGLSHAENVGQVDWAQYDTATTIERVSWKLTNGGFRTNGPTDYFGLRAVGQIEISEAGTWNFRLGSDESAQLYVNGQLVVNDHVPHSYRWSSGEIELDEGLHDFEVRYLERRYSAGLTTTWQGPSMAYEAVIPAAAFSRKDPEVPLDAGEAAISANWYSRVTGNASTAVFDEPVASTKEKRVSWRLTNSSFRTSGSTDYFGLRMTGRLTIPRDGLWTFSVGSDESAVLLIDGVTVVDDSTEHSFRWTDGVVNLTEGEYSFELRFVERRYNAGLFLTWQGPGDPCESVIPASAFVSNQRVRMVRWREVSPDGLDD